MPTHHLGPIPNNNFLPTPRLPIDKAPQERLSEAEVSNE